MRELRNIRKIDPNQARRYDAYRPGVSRWIGNKPDLKTTWDIPWRFFRSTLGGCKHLRTNGDVCLDCGAKWGPSRA